MTTVLEQRARDDTNLREPGTTNVDERRVLRFDDIDAARQSRTDVLVELAEMDRDQLEALRSTYLDRLHRASDDFDATEGLRVVERALARVPRRDPALAWQERLRL